MRKALRTPAIQEVHPGRRGLVRRRYIAFSLLEGPHTIFPPRRRPMLELDQVLHIVNEFDSSPITQSVTLFCDNTVNRHAEFHTPLIRIATWMRREEPDNVRYWPSVTVRWGWLRRGRRRVGDFVRRLTRQLQRAPVVVDGGVFTRNGRPAVRLDDDGGQYELRLQTRLQNIRLKSRGIQGDPIRLLVSKGAKMLEELMVPFDFNGWTECYDHDLSSPDLVKANHWRWNGKAPRTGA